MKITPYKWLFKTEETSETTHCCSCCICSFEHFMSFPLSIRTQRMEDCVQFVKNVKQSEQLKNQHLRKIPLNVGNHKKFFYEICPPPPSLSLGVPILLNCTLDEKVEPSLGSPLHCLSVVNWCPKWTHSTLQSSPSTFLLHLSSPFPPWSSVYDQCLCISDNNVNIIVTSMVSG